MSKPSPPLVSCLMVTKGTPDRLRGIAAAIDCFKRQTYSPRELVIVPDPKDTQAPERIRSVLQTVDAPAVDAPVVRMILVEGPMTLGALRNVSLREAAGAWVCQWDDDDLYHPERIAATMAAVTSSGTIAVLLEEVLHYFPQLRRVWWTNWHATELGGHPATMLCRRDAGISYPESGPESTRGEDTAVVRQIIAAGGLTTLSGKPFLYVYTSNGMNTYDAEHHQMLASSLAVSRGRIARVEASLRAELAAYGAALQGVDVVAPNSENAVFRIAPPG